MRRPRQPQEYFDDGSHWHSPCPLYAFTGRIFALERMRFRQAWRWHPQRADIHHRRRLLFTLWRRQRGHCAYCLRQLTWQVEWDGFRGTYGTADYWAWRSRRARRISLDHVFPHSAGGPDERWNFVAACHACNTAKCARFAVPRLWPFAGEMPDSVLGMLNPAWVREACLEPAQVRAALEAQETL